MKALSLFRRPDNPALAPLKSMVRAVLSLSEDVTVTAQEITCTDPACPGLETIILLLAPGQKTKALKFSGPMVEITENDLRIHPDVKSLDDSDLS
jgi:hypothetical protein